MSDELETTMQEWVTAKQAAKMLGLASPWTIYALRRAGKLRGHSIAGKNSLRFRKEDVRALMKPAEYVPRRRQAAGV
jgi:excisionase family DNA binding protein